MESQKYPPTSGEVQKVGGGSGQGTPRPSALASRAGGMAQANGTKTPRKVQWASNTKEGQNSSPRHLDEGGLNVGSLRIPNCILIRTPCPLHRSLALGTLLFSAYFSMSHPSRAFHIFDPCLNDVIADALLHILASSF